MNTISIEELTVIETRNKEARDLFWAHYRLTIGTGTEADRALVEDQEVTGTVTMGSPQPPVALSATELDALLAMAKSVAKRSGPQHYPPGMGEESRRLHREYNALVAAQRAGAMNGPEVVRLTDEAGAKGIILVPGGENL